MCIAVPVEPLVLMKPADRYPVRYPDKGGKRFYIIKGMISVGCDKVFIHIGVYQSVSCKLVSLAFLFAFDGIKIDKSGIQVTVNEMTHLVEQTEPELVGTFTANSQAQNNPAGVGELNEALNRRTAKMSYNLKCDAALCKNTL